MLMTTVNIFPISPWSPPILQIQGHRFIECDGQLQMEEIFLPTEMLSHSSAAQFLQAFHGRPLLDVEDDHGAVQVSEGNTQTLLGAKRRGEVNLFSQFRGDLDVEVPRTCLGNDPILVRFSQDLLNLVHVFREHFQSVENEVHDAHPVGLVLEDIADIAELKSGHKFYLEVGGLKSKSRNGPFSYNWLHSGDFD